MFAFNRTHIQLLFLLGFSYCMYSFVLGFNRRSKGSFKDLELVSGNLIRIPAPAVALPLAISPISVANLQNDQGMDLYQQGGLSADDIVLILKTGSATPSDRLRAQLQTFASRRYGRTSNNTIIISDAVQRLEVDGQIWEVQDVVGDLSNFAAVNASEKYKIYAAQKSSSSLDSHETHDPPGTNNQGWTLDALKFLPGYSRAATQFPDAKWFIGLDDDNYLFWDSLIQFLALLDHSEKLYIGSPSYMVANNVKFIHGGSVTISSQAAIRARFIEGADGLDRFHEAATSLCCGDGVLAMAYADLKILPNDQHRAFFNGENIEDTETVADQFCLPLLGLHHLSGDEINAIDHEMQWRLPRKRHSTTTRVDVLLSMTQHLENRFQFVEEWDFAKLAHNDRKAAFPRSADMTASRCAAVCYDHSEDCLAWTFELESKQCWSSPVATCGRHVALSTSGINSARLQELSYSCSEHDWRKSVLKGDTIA